MSVSDDTAAYRGSGDERGGAERAASSVPVNGLIGGAVSVLLSMLPFSPLLGGAVAGYLEGGSSTDGAAVGAIAGTVALVPLAAVGLLFLVLPIAPPEPPLAFGGLVAIAVFVGVIYLFGVSVLGGILGSYVNAAVDR